MSSKTLLMEISKTKLSLYASLRMPKHRRRLGLFVAEGDKSVADTLGFFKLEALMATPRWIAGNPGLSRQAGERLYECREQDMRKLSTMTTPPDVMAVYRIPEPKAEPRIPGDSLSLVIDTVQDPGNLGTIIRTADWFGFKVIYASRETVDVYNPKCIQSCMGSMTRVEVVYCDLVELLSSCPPSLPVYGLQLDGKDIFGASLSPAGVIIMGNEGKGISAEVRDFVNSPLLIPPYDAVSHGESLNVASATAITLAVFRNLNVMKGK